MHSFNILWLTLNYLFIKITSPKSKQNYCMQTPAKIVNNVDYTLKELTNSLTIVHIELSTPCYWNQYNSMMKQ